MKSIQGFRLSKQQYAAWKLHQSSASCVSQACIRVVGDAGEARLRRAAGRVVERHEILRTRFRRVPGMTAPLQVVSERADLDWRSVDLTGHEQRAREEELGCLREKDRSRPFDLEEGPLLRFSLVRLSRREWALLVCAHAMCADSRSLRNVCWEVASEWGARSLAADPDDIIQYSQYAEWQAGEVVDVCRAAVVPEYRPETKSLSLAAATLSKVEQLAKSCGVSVDVLLLVCWAQVLRRRTGGARLEIAWVQDGRELPELVRAIGPYAYSKPVRVNVDVIPANGSVHWTDLMSSNLLEYPTSGAIGVEHSFQVHNDCPNEIRGEDGLLIAVGDQCADADRYALKLCCRRAPNSLILELHYNAFLHDHVTAQNCLSEVHGTLEALVESAVTNVETAGGWRPARRAAAGEDVPCTHQLVESQCAATPDSVAIVHGDCHLTYRELDRRANWVAHVLQKRGVGPDSLVGASLERSPELVLGLLGILKAGGAFLPLDPRLPARRLALMLEDAGVTVLMTQENLRGVFGPEFASVTVSVDSDSAGFEGVSKWPPAAAMHPENLAYVLYTSGSTGKPKGVMVPHRGLSNYLAWSREIYAGCYPCSSPLHTSLSFDLGLTSVFLPLLSGGALHVLDDSPGAESLKAALVERDFDLLKLTPSHLVHLAEAAAGGQLASSKDQVLVVGGEQLRGEALAPWRKHAPTTRIFNEYGPTETVVGCTLHAVEPDEPIPSVAPIGRPAPNTQVDVLDASLSKVAEGTTGELYVGGHQVARGYLEDPASTAERFLPSTIDPRPGQRMYKTGDLARRLGDGSLAFLGRADRQVKLRGYRIELAEIEAALEDCPGVLQAVVLLREGPKAEDPRRSGVWDSATTMRQFIKGREAATSSELIAYLVCSEGSPSAARPWRELLHERLPQHMIPAQFIPLAALPLTANGKVDVEALPALPARRSQTEYVEPRSWGERLLAELWSGVFGVPRVGIRDNFFELGGDSMRALQIVARLREAGVEVALEDLFEHQTITSLAQRLKSSPGVAAQEYRPFGLLSDEDRQKVPANVEDAYPLARTQAGVVFHSQHDPHSPTYHDIFVYELRVQFDEALFRRALEQVVARHGVLRTSFDLTEFSEPVQLVHSRVNVPFEVRDLTGLNPSKQAERLAAWMEAEKRTPFVWQTPPMIRFAVDCLAPESIRLILHFHDSIVDGWSTASLVTELLERYCALLDGKAFERDTPPVRYPHFVALERQALQDPECREFWTRKLRNFSVNSLPRWASETKHQGGGRVEVIDVTIDAHISERLRDVASLAGTSIKHVLLAAHVQVMGWLSAQRDVVTGVECHNRVEAIGGEETLGIHLNTLPFCVTLPNRSWLDLVRSVFQTERELMPFKRFPYAEIQKLVGKGALFQTIFNYTHFHVFERVQSLRQIEVLGGQGFGQRHYALSAEFNINPFSGCVQLDLECDLTVGTRADWKRVGDMYSRALQAMATNPEGQIAEVSPLSEAEIHSRVVEWNDTAAVIDGPRTMNRWFEAQVERTPDAIAVVGADGSCLSYAKLNRLSNQLARRLKARGIGAGSYVGLFLPRGADLIAAMLGSLKAGAAYVPLDPTAPRLRCDALAASADLSLVLTHDSVVAAPPQSARDVLWIDWEALATEVGTDLSDGPEPDNHAYVMFTSGSSGAPNGVAISHEGLVTSTYARALVYAAPVRSFLLFPPMTFDSSVAGLFWTLVQGGTLVIPSEETRTDARQLSKLIHDLQVSHWLSVPSFYRVLLDECADDLGCLETAIVAGEVCTPELAALHSRLLPGTALFNEYGPTEATVWSSVYRCPRHPERANVPIGRPIPNTRIYIVDAEFRLVPEGVAGEICIAGPALAHGYQNHCSLTAERFVPDPFSDSPGGRLYRTGDLGCYAADGQIEYLGRGDEQVKVRGVRVELGELEATLRRHALVRDAAVVVWDGRTIAAYVVVDPIATVETAELRRHLAEWLPTHMMPASFIQLPRLPRTLNGKVEKRELPRPKAELRSRTDVLRKIEQLSEDEAAALLRRVQAGEAIALELER